MTDLSHVSFKDVAWLQHFQLTEASVLDYFAMSQFYERTCNNEVLRMQARYTDNEALLRQLHNMMGIEYAVVKSAPPSLFVIAKRERHSPTHTSIVSCYYVMDGSIYMAPSLYSVLEGRFTSAMHYLREAINYASSHVSYDPSKRRYITSSNAQDLDAFKTDPAKIVRMEQIITAVTVDR